MRSPGKPLTAGVARGLSPARARAVRAPGGFTIVEMVVVIAVIALILAIGVPAFNTMTTQQRLSKARQLIDGSLVRARVISISDRTLTAVRLFPAEWQLDEEAASAGGSARRQMLTTYSYRATYAADPRYPAQVVFDERFERIEDGPTQLLPPDTWVAPSEALEDQRWPVGPDWGNTPIGDYVLDGTIGWFELDADSRTNSGEDLLDADDFLIVFDPDTGTKPSLRREPWPIKAYVPDQDHLPRDVAGTEAAGYDWRAGAYREPFQRFNFAGVMIYQREPFVALGEEAVPDDRREVLRRFGQTYYVDRNGGNLVAGAGESGEGG